jgi:hypothetical protein
MAGTFTLHNKFHRANHHTVSATNVIDSGFDPIASLKYPFKGVFYNILTDNNSSYSIDTNSYEWYSTYTTVNSYSATWMLTRSLYNTVSSLSANWNLGYGAYTTLLANSAKYESVFTTVCSYSAEWGSPFLMFTNKVQEYTHSKTFSGQTLVNNGLEGLSSFDWNLNTQQVAFLTLDRDIFINKPFDDTFINGGLYTLVIKQKNDGVVGTGYEVEFDATCYRFNNRVDNPVINVVNKSLSGITVINFIAINELLYGDVTYLSGNNIT